MSTTALNPLCAKCGRPVGSISLTTGSGLYYHSECAPLIAAHVPTPVAHDAVRTPITPLLPDDGRATWMQVFDLFQAHGILAPPVKLRDEIVCLWMWAHYGKAAADRLAAANAIEEPVAWLVSHAHRPKPAVWLSELEALNDAANTLEGHPTTPIPLAPLRERVDVQLAEDEKFLKPSDEPFYPKMMPRASDGRCKICGVSLAAHDVEPDKPQTFKLRFVRKGGRK